MEIAQPKTFEKRQEVAQGCSAALDLKIPILVDDMEDSVSKAYSGFPDRLFILEPGGKIAYSGGRGPWGFKVPEMTEALEELLK